MKWFVYMVITSKGNVYTGVSTDPARRVYDHNYTKKGAKYLRGQRPVRLIWKKMMKNKSEALREERSIKDKSRFQKLMIASSECLISYDEIEEMLFK